MTLSLSIDLGRPLELLQTSVVARLPPLRDGNKTERNGTPKSFGYVARNSEYLLKQALLKRKGKAALPASPGPNPPRQKHPPLSP